MSTYKLIEIYLDYKNNFLTIKGYANYYGIEESFANNLVSEATSVYKSIYG